MTVFEAYITNLGKYAEGQLVGETLKFPATTEEVQSLLKNIGVDGVLYEEFFITAFDGDVMGLYDYLTEYENLDELNHLAHLISELDSDEIETLEAALNKGDHIASGLPRRTCRSSVGCWRRTLNHWTACRSRWRPPVSSSYWSGCVRKQGWSCTPTSPASRKASRIRASRQASPAARISSACWACILSRMPPRKNMRITTGNAGSF